MRISIVGPNAKTAQLLRKVFGWTEMPSLNAGYGENAIPWIYARGLESRCQLASSDHVRVVSMIEYIPKRHYQELEKLATLPPLPQWVWDGLLFDDITVDEIEFEGGAVSETTRQRIEASKAKRAQAVRDHAYQNLYNAIMAPRGYVMNLDPSLFE